VTLDTSETLFSVLAAINTCGYNAELDISDPLRQQIRAEVAKASQSFDQAKEETVVMCQFYHEHEPSDPSHILSQYISLALRLDAPPGFAFKVKDADLPPDAGQVSGMVPILQKFYDVAGLHAIWLRHQAAYSALAAQYHDAVAKMLFDTQIYLRLQSAGYLGHTFTVLIDPLGAPGQTNARNYGSDYYVVISPGKDTRLKMEQIRHTYLHYLLDPMAAKYPTMVGRLNPLLAGVKRAPMEQSFKEDVSLLMTECFIRAIEIRTGTPKLTEPQQQAAVDQAVKQGYVLTQYFYEALAKFEKEPVGLRNNYVEIVGGIDIGKQQRLEAQTQYATVSDAELLRTAPPRQSRLLITAEQRLSAGDSETARKLAQEALDTKSEDPGRAYFILAQVATMNHDSQGARNYFEQALAAAREPKVVAWSHIYLGRILDLEEERAAALDHYRAALNLGAEVPEVKAAAERGLQTPYEPPSHPQQN